MLRSTNFRILLLGMRNPGGTPLTTMATQAEIGSAWGAAYDRVRKKYFTASVYRRHAPLGPGETGGRIYVIDNANSASPGTPTKFIDLVSDLGISVGAIQSNAARGLPNNKFTASVDNLTFSAVGKVGLGDIDVSDDGQFLFVVNLFDKKVYKINIAQVVAGTPNATALPDFTLPCSNGNSRPWGLGMWDGELYLGVVCDALSGTTANLKLTVQKFNFTANSWTEVLNVVPDWDKGDVIFGSAKYKWQKWEDVWDNYVASNWPVHPQPIISDIEFDEEGSMHLAVLDRTGFQSGHRQMRVPDDGGLYTGVTGGELLRTYKDPTTGAFSLENNGSSGPYNSGGTGNNSQTGQGGANTLQGPGGGEFYCDDHTTTAHSETTSGGLSLVKGSRRMASVQMDPIDGQVDAQGIVWFNTTNGLEAQEYQVFYNAGTPSPEFSKQNGLGDLEYLADPAPIEIGNRVWMDTDNDGVQDADEMGLDGIAVKLFSGATLIATKTTANGGQYYFTTADGVLPNTAYTIRIEAASIPSGKSVTLKDQPTGGVQDLGDNDASLVGGNADITYTTGNVGENNHTLDFGFGALPVCGICPPSLTIAGLGFGSGSAPLTENVTTDGSFPLSESNIAGFLSTGSSEGVFYTFCTEITQPLLPLQNPYTHTANGSPNGFTSLQALRVAQVFQAAGFTSALGLGAGNNTTANMVALQMAVWNAFYDTDYSISTGNFQMLTDNNVGVRAIANAWLLAAQSIAAPNTSVHRLTNPVGQDLVLQNCITTEPSTCNATNNTYSVTGFVSFANAPATGSLTVSVSGGGNQVFNAPFTSPQAYTITGLTADGSSHTVTAVFSADLTCESTATYTAPANCTPPLVCSSTVTAAAGPCNAANNQYTVTGQVTLTNPPSTGTVTVQIVGGGNQTFTLPQTSPISYSIAGQIADGTSHTVNVSISGVSCASTISYNAPASCIVNCPSPNCLTL